MILFSHRIKTPLGDMIALADNKSLYMLQFTDYPKLDCMIQQVTKILNASVEQDECAPILTISKELDAYFLGELTVFKTPIHLTGTSFQKQAWQALMALPYGCTQSYTMQACYMHQPSAHRAVANANGANRCVIVIPCHRIIAHSGTLGGYGAGLHRKQWLLEHEKRVMQLKLSLF